MLVYLGTCRHQSERGEVGDDGRWEDVGLRRNKERNGGLEVSFGTIGSAGSRCAQSLDFVKARKKKLMEGAESSSSRVAKSIWREMKWKGTTSMESAGSGRGMAMEQNKKSINDNEQSDVHHPKRFLPPNLGFF
jgi:hypothetical protein